MKCLDEMSPWYHHFINSHWAYNVKDVVAVEGIEKGI